MLSQSDNFKQEHLRLLCQPIPLLDAKWLTGEAGNTYRVPSVLQTTAIGFEFDFPDSAQVGLKIDVF